jgi:SAM-dependent methyltransferase
MSDESTANFAAYGRYYDLLYPEKDYAAEADYVQGLLLRHGDAVQQLLEFGCGTGRHARHLIQRGYAVEGIDRSQDMLNEAATIGGLTGHLGDARSLSLGRTFDAVLALFHVLNYQIDNASALSFFGNAARHLRPGGLYVFDTWYSPAVYAQRPERRVKTARTEAVDLTRVAEPTWHVNENRIDVNYRIEVTEHAPPRSFTLSETHAMRHFSLPELDLLALATGFTRIAAEEFLTGLPAGTQSWGVAVVMRKLP